MKHVLIAGVALLSGCSPVAHSFTVDAENAGSPVASAAVTLCGQPAKTLLRSGTQFRAVVANRCEGEGSIRLRFANGATADCSIGYVTTLEDKWNFEVRGRSCVPAKSTPV